MQIWMNLEFNKIIFMRMQFLKNNYHFMHWNRTYLTLLILVNRGQG